MTNLQLGGKMKKDVFASSVTSVERRKKIGLTIFLTLLTHAHYTRHSTLLIPSVCVVCVTYELRKSLTKLTVYLAQ